MSRKILKYRIMYFVYRIEMLIWSQLRVLVTGLTHHLSHFQDKVLAIQKDIMNDFENGGNNNDS